MVMSKSVFFGRIHWVLTHIAESSDQVGFSPPKKERKEKKKEGTKERKGLGKGFGKKYGIGPCRPVPLP